MKKAFIFLFISIFLAAAGFQASAGAQTDKTKTLTNMFQEKAYGYTVKYPGNWGYAKRSEHIIVFTKKEGADASTPVIGIQNLNSTKVKEGKHKDVDAVIEDFTNQLKITKHAKVYVSEPYVYNKNGLKLSGKQFLAEYTFNNKNYKQWIIVIPRPDGQLFHTWIYSSPADQYDKYMGTAQAMLETFTITR